ncbi:hypothetical protein SBOR_7137 [Sclerotinia borealis F-4128]|uniref:Uncharacterized protein n=1 Tax=Sclerotinia borealis (strain F-4128) TaxID=1432307 RepID=W9CCB4_SCLBF|nr:hypothetical protein SBOR_7137 [Sclerotinia borealis F-4128]
MEYRLSFLLLPAVSWAAVISTPLSTDRDDQINEIKQSNPISSSLICTSNCNAPSTSSQPLELREYREYHTHSFHHAKYDDQEPPPRPHIPTSWKVAIGVNAFVLLITASILGMLVWILRKEYRKRNLLQGDPTYVGAKDGFGRKMKSARSTGSRGLGMGMGNARGGRARAWSYDPIREEEEEGVGQGLGQGLGLEGGNTGMSMPMAMNNTLVNPGTQKESQGGTSAKGKGKETSRTKRERVWRGKHVRFSSWSGDVDVDGRDRMGVVGVGSSGKENGVAALRAAEAHEYVQTP